MSRSTTSMPFCRADRCRVQRTIEDEEKILAGAFAEQPGRRQRDAFAEAEPARLARDELAGKIVAAGFRTGRYRVRREALPARHARVDALLEHVGTKVRAHLPRRDGDIGRRIRRETETAEPAIRDRAKIRGAEPVRVDDFAARGLELLQRIRDRDVVDLRGVEQPDHVFGEPEDRRSARRHVAADAFEYGRAVVQRMRHHVHGRLGPRLDAAVVPDMFGIGLGHRGDVLREDANDTSRRRPGRSHAACFC